MRLEQSFEVPVPVAQAWGVLLDIERIAPCMPGATLTGFDGTGFTGLVKLKLGPVSLAYKGNGRFVERDEPGRRVVIVASGQDSRGAGGAQARVTAVLHAANGGSTTQVKVVTDLDIAGKAAQFGRGMIADVSNKLIKQFSDCLATTIASAAPVPPAAAEAATAVPAPAAEPAPSAAPLAAASAAPSAPQVEPIAAAPVAEVPAPPPPPPPPPAEVAPAPAEVAPAGTPPPPSDAPAYHPLALQEPASGTPPAPPPAPPAAAEPTPPPVKPAEVYAYEPEPAPKPPASTPEPPPAKPAPVENEPIDLLAISGAKGAFRKAAPYLIVIAIVVVALIVWLAAT